MSVQCRPFCIAALLIVTTQRLPAPISDQATPAPSKSNENIKHQFDGTWIATFSKKAANEREINGSYTIIVKEGKVAVKNIDLTIVSRSDNPLYGSERELRAVWICSSANITPKAATLIVEWNEIQLSSWTPRSIPQEIVQNFSPPSGHMISVYAISGDELTRINPSEGVVYHRIR